MKDEFVVGTNTDTVAAIATPAGLGGIAIVRISGEQALQIASRLLRLRFGKSLKSKKSWSALLADVVDPETGNTVDEAVVIVMKAPHSYTKEDVVEIQCHGGNVVAQKVLSLVLSRGARHALPGEFTMRAFLSGRITLDEAEAVLDVINAQTENALGQAGRRLKGALGTKVEGYDQRLKIALASLEASIDYPEDVDDVTQCLVDSLEELVDEIQLLLDSAPLGLALSSGIEVCLVGQPNAGKSALFNGLLAQDRAIVTDVPGTTRDVLREKTEWDGVPIVLLDTAGLRETHEIVEAIGVKRAESAAQSAEVVIYVLDDSRGITEEDELWLKRLSDTRLIAAVNKSDLGLSLVDEDKLSRLVPHHLKVSGKTGQGLESLKERIVSLFRTTEVETVVPGSARQVDCLKRARDAIERAVSELKEGWPEDVVALSLTEAASAFADLTGKDVTEETLNEVFSRFCVGK